ncbi:MAG: c-type cytochrome [Gammaproteobacteria bacterium]|nr:c-type cytochrome [Gammaproteobacteria bacterium]
MLRHLTIAALLVSGNQTFAIGDLAAGKALYTPCAVCHGLQAEGNEVLHAPKLAGQADWYLTRQLQNFKAGIRGVDKNDLYGQQMAPMTATLVDDNAVTNVVAFIRSLPDVPVKAKVTGDAARGKAAYAACATCHWWKAEGMQAMDAPRLAGMSDWYLVQQLRNFRSGLRGKHPKDAYGMQMLPIAAALADDQAVNDVIAYINSIGN